MPRAGEEDLALVERETLSTTLAKNVMLARKAQSGMTQEELARASGVSRATIAQLEGGDESNDPRLSTIVSLARALDTSPFLLLMGRTRDSGDRSHRAGRHLPQQGRRGHLTQRAGSDATARPIRASEIAKEGCRDGRYGGTGSRTGCSRRRRGRGDRHHADARSRDGDRGCARKSDVSRFAAGQSSNGNR